jgi:uncharacterized protein YcfL
LLAVCVLGLAFAGCSGPDLVKAPAGPVDDPLAFDAYPEIVLLDGLDKALVKQKGETSRATASEPMTVRATLRSVRKDPIVAQYRFVFFDENGRQLTRNPVKHQVTFEPLTRRTIEANAIDMNAARYELQISRPK